MLAALALVAGACGGDSGAARSGCTQAPTVALFVPDGWAADDTRAAVAQNESDLRVEVPAGPRARVVSELQDADVRAALQATDVNVLEGRREARIDGHVAVTVGLVSTEGGTKMFRYHYSLRPCPEQPPVAIVAEAPDEQWTAEQWTATMEILSVAVLRAEVISS